MAAVRMSRALVPRMQRRGGGVILNTASICARQPLGYEPMYTTTKAALVLLSKCLANELIAQNIRVNAVNPGLILTPDWRKTAAGRLLRRIQLLPRRRVAEDCGVRPGNVPHARAACGEFPRDCAAPPAGTRMLTMIIGCDCQFFVLHMEFPFLFEAWSVHHATRNVFLDLSGTGTAADALPVCCAAVGGQAFIPLEFDTVVWGSDERLPQKESTARAVMHLRHMGAGLAQRTNIFGETARKLFERG